MQRTRVAIIGYGNVGRAAADAVTASPDFELAGIVRRKVTTGELLHGQNWTVPAVTNISDLERTEAALVCVPTRELERIECELLQLGITVVDAFDMHADAICAHKQALQDSAISGGAVGVIASGWDPGINSLIRALMEVMAPRGITYTDFGPGMSMGHSSAARSVPGVSNAISITLPTGYGRHRRSVYVVLDGSRPFKEVANDIMTDSYFASDETEVVPVASLAPFTDSGHSATISRKGTAANLPNQCLEWHISICNPAITAQVMLAALRAALKSDPGVYTLLELPIAHMLPGSLEEAIKRLN